MSMREFITYLALQPGSASAAVFPRANRRSPPIGKLLDWLVNDWKKPTVTAGEIRVYGPNATRDKQMLLSLTQSLVERGWLVPIPTRQRNMKQWRVVRGSSSPPPPSPPPPPPIGKLLEWLVNDWKKSTVTAREIRTYGPNAVRNRNSTTGNSAADPSVESARGG
jgi:hypothetical protein